MTRRSFVKRAGLWVPVIGALALPHRADAAVSYFGQTATTGGSEAASAGYSYYNARDTTGVDVTCPGSGSQSVVSLGLWNRTAGAGGSYRLDIYLTDGTFVMQGSAALSVAAWADWAWVEHTAFVDAAGSAITSPVLTGGTDYLLALSIVNGYTYLVANSAGDGMRKASDYTAGFPSPLSSSWEEIANTTSIRCGVEPAAASGARRRPPFAL